MTHGEGGKLVLADVEVDERARETVDACELVAVDPQGLELLQPLQLVACVPTK